MLGIVYRTIASHLIRQAGLRVGQAKTGAVTAIQRFGNTLNLNVHLHLLVLDGVYAQDAYGGWHCHRVPAPSAMQLQQIVKRLARRIGRCLERAGWLRRQDDTLETDGLERLRSHSILYRIALGPHAGRKVFTLQTLPAIEAAADGPLAQAFGFSLHAGVWAGANDRQQLERLCRYIARPAVSEERLALTDCGHVRYTLKPTTLKVTSSILFAEGVPWRHAMRR